MEERVPIKQLDQHERKTAFTKLRSEPWSNVQRRFSWTQSGSRCTADYTDRTHSAMYACRTPTCMECMIEQHLPMVELGARSPSTDFKMGVWSAFVKSGGGFDFFSHIVCCTNHHSQHILQFTNYLLQINSYNKRASVSWMCNVQSN